MSLSLKNTDSTQFFKIKPDTQVDQKNKSGWKKTQWEGWSHAEKRLLP